MMKLLTLNSHSLEEEDYEHKLIEFERAILRESPHIIALQEVNQRTAKILPAKPSSPRNRPRRRLRRSLPIFFPKADICPALPSPGSSRL